MAEQAETRRDNETINVRTNRAQIRKGGCRPRILERGESEIPQAQKTVINGKVQTMQRNHKFAVTSTEIRGRAGDARTQQKGATDQHTRAATGLRDVNRNVRSLTDTLRRADEKKERESK